MSDITMQEAPQSNPEPISVEAITSDRWWSFRNCWPSYLLLLIACVAFGPLFRYFWHRWWEEDHGAFGYGYFVPPTMAYLFWCRREQFKASKVEPAKTYAWILLALSCVALAIGIRASVTAIQSLAFAVALLAIPYCLWGGQIFSHARAGLLYGWTMIPWPGQATGGLLVHMQQLSTDSAAWTLNKLGILTIVDGTTVQMPNFAFDVAVACAGLTILFPTVAIAILTAMMVEAKLWRKLLLIVVSIPISVVSNTLRICLIGLIGNAGGKALAERLHDSSGLLGVILASFLLYFFGLMIGCAKYLPEYTPKFAQEEIA